MKIIPYDGQYLDELVTLLVEVFTEPGTIEWDEVTAKRYLLQNTKPFSTYCFVALDEARACMGGIFARIEPYGVGDMLYIDALQIKQQFRKQGVAKALMKTAIEKANGVGI